MRRFRSGTTPWFPLVLVLVASGILRRAGAESEPAPPDAGCYAGPPLSEIIPKPRQVRYSAVWTPLVKRGSKKPEACVRIEPKAPAAVRVAARELSNRCALLAERAWGDGARSPRLPVVTEATAAARFPVVVVLTDAVDKTEVALPARLGAEGYRIAWRRRETQTRIVCRGHDPRGVYYATQSLQQMCAVRGDTVALRLVDVLDQPAYRIRCSGNDGSIPSAPGVCENAVAWLPRFKLNAWAVGESYVWPADWRVLPPRELAALERACRLAARNGTLDVIFQIHPFRGRPRDKQYNMVISDPKEVDTFVGLCDRMLTAGARGILFRADDYHPLSPEDQARFGDKAEAHAFLIRALHRRLKARHPDYFLIFCPPYYHGARAVVRPEESAYLRKLAAGIPADVHVMWTGPVTRSLEITSKQVADFKALIGRDPFLWDNTVYAHRNRYGYDVRHPGYLFDRFETKYPADYPATCPGIRYNWGYNGSRVGKVGNVTIAEYLWNPEGYDPKASLRKAVEALYGSEAVDDLLTLRDSYYQIKDAAEAGRGTEPAVFADMKQAAGELSAILDRLPREGVSGKVVRELRSRVETVLSLFHRLQPTMKKSLAVRRTKLAAVDFREGAWHTTTKGKWTATTTKTAATFRFPVATRSFAGAFGAVTGAVTVPPSPTGKYYLAFSVFDDYDGSGTPPFAWPGYLRKQVLVDDALVWEDDVEGVEPPAQEALQLVDVTRYARPGRSLSLTFRGYDLRGVGNMGATIRFADAALVAGPCTVRRSCVEVPDCPPLRVPKEFTIVMRFTPRRFGQRQSLYAKTNPFEYFAFQDESGRLVAGVFVGRKEVSVSSRETVTPGQVNTLAFVCGRGAVRLLVNGVPAGSRPVDGPVDLGAGPLCIGAYSATGPYYDGTIHEFAFYRRALPLAVLRDPNTAHVEAAAKRELTFNGGCEQVDTHRRPQGWRSPGGPGTGGEYTVTTDAHTGKYAVRLTGSTKNTRETLFVHGAEQPQGGFGYPATPGALYHFSVWMRGDGDLGRVKLEPAAWTDAEGTLRPKPIRTFPVWVGDRWTQAEGTFSAPKDATRFGLQVRVPAAGATPAKPPQLLIDDIQVEKLPTDLAGWWKLDAPHLPTVRDLAGMCPDGALYRDWEVAAPNSPAPVGGRKPH